MTIPKKDPFIVEKSKQTSLERWGVSNPAKSPLVRAQISSTKLNKPEAERQHINQKRMQTNTEKYGFPYVMQVPSIKENFDWAGVYLKSQKTQRSRGYHPSISKVETEFLEALRTIFGSDDVKAQVPIENRWVFDGYVVSLDTYVQLDGVYWHGLNRPIDVIREFKSSKDAAIYRTWLKDQEQNAWAVNHGIKLVRITDKEFRQWQKEKRLLEQIKAKLIQ